MEIINHLYQNGKKLKEIQNELGISLSKIKRYLRENNLNNRSKSYSEEFKKQTIELWLECRDTTLVSKNTGISVHVINRLINDQRQIYINCKTCGKELSNPNTIKKFCNKICKYKCSEYSNFSYKNQKARGWSRKIEWVLKKGGKCSMCGYSKNIHSLSFHHSDPETKEYEPDFRFFTNQKMSVIEEEMNKCELLCLNCHSELHNPSGENWWALLDSNQ